MLSVNGPLVMLANAKSIANAQCDGPLVMSAHANSIANAQCEWTLSDAS